VTGVWIAWKKRAGEKPLAGLNTDRMAVADCVGFHRFPRDRTSSEPSKHALSHEAPVTRGDAPTRMPSFPAAMLRDSLS